MGTAVAARLHGKAGVYREGTGCGVAVRGRAVEGRLLRGNSSGKVDSG